LFYLVKQLEKQNKVFQKQMSETTQMMMAGSFEEWKRIKDGKKPIPNKIKSEKNFKDLDESERIPFSQIQGIKVDNEPRRKVKLYS